MVIGFRPCQRKARWRRKHFPERITRFCICMFGVLVIIGLLFLCPQWLLVLMIAILAVVIFLLVKR